MPKPVLCVSHYRGHHTASLMKELGECVPAQLDSWMDCADWRKAGLFRAAAAAKRTLLTDLWDAVLAFRVDRAEAGCLPPSELLH